VRNGVTANRFGTDVKDGASTTLLLSENTHKDSDLGHTWLSSPYLSRTGLAGLATEQAFGMIWVYAEGVNVNTPPSSLFAPFNQDLGVTSSYIAAGDFGQPFTRPASSHPGLFITAFVEGNTRSINQNIEYRVYQQLMTPNGNKAVYPGITDKTDLQAMRNFFGAKPLSDSDY
jgi:hypothetical protein